MIRDFLICLITSLIFTGSIVSFTIATTNESVIHSGIASGMEEAAAAIKGFGRLLDSFKSIIDIISNIVSPEVLLLFIAASLIGLGLSFLGVPKGGVSFLCSLLIADLFWFIWVKSFNPGFPDVITKLLLIIKINLVIIIPFIAVYFLKSGVFTGKILPGILSFFKSIFKRKRSPDLFNKKEIASITTELNESISMLQKSVLNDILNQNDKDKIRLSAGTLKRKKELEEILNRFEKS